MMRHEGHIGGGDQAPSVVAVVHSMRPSSTLAALLAELDPTTMSVVIFGVDIDPLDAAGVHDVIRAAGFSLGSCSDGAALQIGRAYVAPSDWRVWFEGRCLRMGLKSLRHPLSLDRVLESLARAWGKRSRVLTADALLGDGEAGLVAVQRAGGLVLASDASGTIAPASSRRPPRDAGDAPPSSRAPRSQRGSSSPPFRVHRLFPFSGAVLRQLQAATERAVRRAEERDRVRVWLPRCKTGGLAYAVAMLLREVAVAPRHVQVFGTDDDEEALAVARAARYPTQAALGMDPALRARYTFDEGDAVRIAESLRESCIFSPHKLAHSPPFSRMDMIICHRVFDGVSVTRRADILDTLYFALRDEGELLALDHRHYFEDDRFELTPEGYLKRRPRTRAYRGSRPRPTLPLMPSSVDDGAWSRRDLEAILASLPPGVAVHDARGAVLHFDRRSHGVVARTPAGDSGRGKSHRASLARLYSEAMPPWIQRVLQTGEPVHGLELSVEHGGHLRFWICNLAPIRSADGSVTGVTSAVHDISSLRHGGLDSLEADPERALPARAEGYLESHIAALMGAGPPGKARTGV